MAAVALIATAAALAGAVTEAAAAPASAYRASADRLCATANARLAALPAPRTAGDVRGWVMRAVPIMTRSTRRVRALSPPARLRARHRAWTGAVGRRAATARALRRRIAGGAPPVTTLNATLPRLDRQKRIARRRARALGLRACSGRR